MILVRKKPAARYQSTVAENKNGESFFRAFDTSSSTAMRKLVDLLITTLGIASTAVAHDEYVSEAFLIVRRVLDRLERDTTRLHDVLCVNCDEQVFEDVIIRLQKERPFVTMRRFSLVAGSRVQAPTTHRLPSLVLQSCTPETQCQWDETFRFSNPYKYAVYIQLIRGLPSSRIIFHANELVSSGILQILQFIAPSANFSNTSNVHVVGALTRRMITVLNDSDAEKQLFDGTLTSFKNFTYEVGFVPLFVHLYTKGNTFHNLEIATFLTVLEKQGAGYRFHGEGNLRELLGKLLSGRMHVLLNSIETSGNYFEFAHWKDIQEYCIILPRRYERMHLQLLLTPFKWQIWMMIVLILVVIQIISLLYPDRVPRYLILKCFFGGGEPEHNLATGNRLIVCVICILIFLFTETYQAILLSLMSADPFVKNPETIEEFIEQNQTLLIMKGTQSDMPSKLKNLLRAVDRMDLNMTLKNASVASCDLAHFLNKNPYDWELPVKADLIVIKPRLYYRLKHIVFSWTCPAVREYQRYMDLIYDVGLYHKDQLKWIPERVHRRTEQSFNDLIVLTDDLIPVWELLGTGLSAAFACFVSENLVYRLHYVTQKAKRFNK
ncbi:uncharacterized protein LOC118511005 [Anopheles stephensi]|uniref:uncharacterized protein LOC118511005 n=1 Tax=Anopheles stephensi TaxID=30069 RepID=UPI0016589DF9|nr:uncharacterized protein LOC118511005 [Anopheles stephensi]